MPGSPSPRRASWTRRRPASSRSMATSLSAETRCSGVRKRPLWTSVRAATSTMTDLVTVACSTTRPYCPARPVSSSTVLGTVGGRWSMACPSRWTLARSTKFRGSLDRPVAAGGSRERSNSASTSPVSEWGGFWPLSPAPRTAKTIIDPMVGSADLLVSCLAVGAEPEQLVGLELDPLALARARAALARARVRTRTGRRLLGVASARAVRPRDHQSAVYPLPVQGRRRRLGFPPANRCALVCCGPSRVADALSDDARRCFLRAARSYPGTSDIAVPAWILSAALVREGGSARRCCTAGVAQPQLRPRSARASGRSVRRRGHRRGWRRLVVRRRSGAYPPCRGPAATGRSAERKAFGRSGPRDPGARHPWLLAWVTALRAGRSGGAPQGRPATRSRDHWPHRTRRARPVGGRSRAGGHVPDASCGALWRGLETACHPDA